MKHYLTILIVLALILSAQADPAQELEKQLNSGSDRTLRELPSGALNFRRSELRGVSLPNCQVISMVASGPWALVKLRYGDDLSDHLLMHRAQQGWEIQERVVDQPTEDFLAFNGVPSAHHAQLIGAQRIERDRALLTTLEARWPEDSWWSVSWVQDWALVLVYSEIGEFHQVLVKRTPQGFGPATVLGGAVTVAWLRELGVPREQAQELLKL